MSWDTFSLIALRATTPADRLIRDEKQQKYVKQLAIFVASVIAFLTFIRSVRLLCALAFKSRATVVSSKAKEDLEKFDPSGPGKVSLRYLPATISAVFRIIAFRWTISIGGQAVASVSELAFISGYMGAILIWLLADTRDLTTMFWQDRAAHLASSQISLVVALAGKNNTISFLTGISHEKLNVLHRAAARTLLILLWMHAVARTASGLPQQFDFTHNWVRSGAVGLTAFSLASFLSIRPIRRMAFELFLVSHIFLIAIFLICGYFHARDVGYGAYIWPASAIWALDRVLRLARMLWNNRVGNRNNPAHSTASMELLSEDTIRLTFRRRFTWTPGQHAYVTLPTISKSPTEAHPFTISSIPEPINGTDDREVVFLIRARAGFTKRLRDHAVRHGSCTVPALLDGPYGYPPDLRPFSTCVLIAGGSGISYTLPLLMNLIRENVRGGNSAVRRIVFVWAVRDGDHLTWISRALTEALSSTPSSITIDPRVYVTGSAYPTPEVPVLSHLPSDSISAKDAVTPTGLPLYSALKLVHGRPSIRKLLQNEISTSSGPISVDVAGPSGLSGSVRRALYSDIASPLAVLRGRAPVTLHVETFGMVKE